MGHEEASSHEILEFVKNLSMPSSEDFDDELVVRIDRLLRTRLDDVAARVEEPSDFTAASSLNGSIQRFRGTVPFNIRLELP